MRSLCLYFIIIILPNVIDLLRHIALTQKFKKVTSPADDNVENTAIYSSTRVNHNLSPFQVFGRAKRIKRQLINYLKFYGTTRLFK